MIKVNLLSRIIIISVLRHLLVYCDVLERVTEESESCETTCDKTYPLHTYPSAEHLNCCKRGCRLYTMIDLVYDFQNSNSTRDSCMSSCMEAYTKTAERYACTLGCNNQVSKKHHEAEKSTGHLLTPLLYIQTMYSTLVNHVSKLVTASWTLYVQQDSGKMVVVHSQPETVQEYGDLDDALESQELDFAENHMPSRIIGSPINSLSQHYSRNSHRLGVAMTEYSREDTQRGTEKSAPTDWLGCISRQSGLPRWLLVMVLFMAVMVMAWLCCASTVGAPEQHMRPRNVSIVGDLEYLLMYSPAEKIKIQPPRDDQAPPLPVKIHLEQA